IRDRNVTGVQTCALPISSIECTDGGGACPPEDVGGIGFYNELADWFRSRGAGPPPGGMDYRQAMSLTQSPAGTLDRDSFDPDARSEERRVGKECRERWSR